MVSFESTDPVEQFLIEVHNLCDRDGRIGGYRLGEDPPDELRIARILVAKMIAHHLEHSGQYVTNDATREKAIVSAYRHGYAAGREDEREACAKAAEDFLAKGRSPLGRAVGFAIRNRGQA